MKSKKSKKYIALGVFSLLFILFGLFMPIPYYIEAPGDAFDLDEMITVESADKSSDEKSVNKSSGGESANTSDNEKSASISDNGKSANKKDQGSYSMTTIGISQATPFSAISGLLSYHDLVSEEEIFSGVESGDQYDFIQNLYMKNSVDNAIQVAFQAAGAKYEVILRGVYVLEIMPESYFSGALEVGDLITQVDEQAVTRSDDLIDYLAKKSPSDSVTLRFKRDEKEYEVTGDLMQLDTGKTGIGIALVDDSELKTSPKIDVNFGDIGGPSAGLLYSLYIYDQLTQGDLNGDLHVSGTGTINLDGSVGSIGGADKKVLAADQAGADIFFVPSEDLSKELKGSYPDYKTNYEEALAAAKDIGTKMKIVPVAHFKDAVDYLKQLKKK